MALNPCEGAEPIAGYRLVDRLGTGGFGEVWKALAPGGLTKAIKLVYGHMQDVRAEQELKALSRIRDVRHPFLLSLERFEIVEGQLIIVTELAEMSLQDRYDFYRKEGTRGIPRDELLICIRDAAEALDYMSEQFGLQHLDIKPQNLLLVGGRIKVADFGLVKNLQGSSATATGGVTPVYASPEAFDGRVSKFSDQYSLAIVYQEMLTGMRPFPGSTPLQLAMQHTHSPPMLDSLPGPDRGVIARALSKTPDKRFPTCRAMVEELLTTKSPAPRRSSRSIPQPELPVALPRADAATSPVSRMADHLLNHATSLGSAALDGPTALPVGQPEHATTVRPELVLAPTRNSNPGASMLPSSTLERGLRPTLYVGIGGLACKALRRLRTRLQDRFGSAAAVPVLRTLLIDTDRASFRQDPAAAAEEPPALLEMLVTPLRKPEQYRAQARELLRWLDRRWLYGIPRSLLTEGMRPLGRLALLDNANELLTRLRVLLRDITEPETIQAAEAATQLGLRDSSPRVFLVASISGGTGSGMLVEVAYAIRQVLAEMHFSEDALCGLLLHATSQRPAAKELARVNAQATLSELHHFGCSWVSYPGDLRSGLKAFPQGVPPFECGYILHLGDDHEEASAALATDHLAEFLYLNGVSAASGLCEEQTAAPRPGGGLALRTFGMSRIVLPRYRLSQLAAEHFCQLLVRRWRGTFNTPEQERQELDSFRKHAAPTLDVDTVAGHLYAAAGEILREEPRAYLKQFLEQAFTGETLVPGDARIREVFGKVLEQLGAKLGSGGGHGDTEDPRLTDFEIAFRDRAIELGDRLARSVLEWLVGLVENPRGRLIKAADQIARWFLQHLMASCDALSNDLERLRSHRAASRERLAKGDIPVPEPSGTTWFGRRPKQPALEPQPWFLEYCMLRLREISLENTLSILWCVHGRVAAFTEDVGRSLEKLRHFGERLSTGGTSSGGNSLTETPTGPVAPPPVAVVPNVTELLPDMARTLERAAEVIFDRESPQIIEEFEACLQAEVFNPLGGLWSILAGPRDLDVVLNDVLRKRAREAMLAAIREFDAAELFLARSENPLHLPADVKLQIEAAAPRLSVAAESRHLVALLPPGPAGTTLAELVKEVHAGSPAALSASEGDVIFCQLSNPLPLAVVAGLLLGTRGSYVEAAQKVHTRIDVNWTSFVPVEQHVPATA